MKISGWYTPKVEAKGIPTSNSQPYKSYKVHRPISYFTYLYMGYTGVVTNWLLVLTFDPNFQRDIQVGFGQDPRWRFSLGFPSKNVIILVVTGILGSSNLLC